MRRTHALILLLVVLAFVAGLLASSVFTAASTSETAGRLSGAPTGSRDAEVVTLLGELRAELARLNDHLQRGSLMPSSMPAERRREPEANTDTLGAISELASMLKGSARMAPSPGDYGVGLRAPAPDATRPPVPIPVSAEKNEQFGRSHVFWTYQQVLDRYGRPDEISAHENSQNWYYRESDRVLTFRFSQGFVIGTSAD